MQTHLRIINYTCDSHVKAREFFLYADIQQHTSIYKYIRIFVRHPSQREWTQSWRVLSIFYETNSSSGLPKIQFAPFFKYPSACIYFNYRIGAQEKKSNLSTILRPSNRHNSQQTKVIWTKKRTQNFALFSSNSSNSNSTHNSSSNGVHTLTQRLTAGEKCVPTHRMSERA